MKDKRVLHIISALGMGGAETWLMELLRYQNANKELNLPKMDFVLTFGVESVFDEEARSLGAELFYLTLNKNTVTSFVRGFRKILSTKNYIAIHDHQDYISGWHFLFGLFLLPKVRITHVHNPSYQIYTNYGITLGRVIKIKIGSILVRLLATHIKGTSNQILKEYKLVRDNSRKMNQSALYCSFDLSRYRTSKSFNHLRKELNLMIDDKVVLFVGRLDYSLDVDHPKNHKNSAFALHIFKYLKDKNYKLLFVGANEYILNDFLSKAKELDVINNIRILGLRNDVPDLMNLADILLFPSRAEGLGMVAVEAQAAGLPVLVSDTVPKECIVISELMHFYNLKLGPSNWAKKITEIINTKVPTIGLSDSRWVNSPFNVKFSIQELNRIYNSEDQFYN